MVKTSAKKIGPFKLESLGGATADEAAMGWALGCYAFDRYKNKGAGGTDNGDKFAKLMWPEGANQDASERFIFVCVMCAKREKPGYVSADKLRQFSVFVGVCKMRACVWSCGHNRYPPKKGFFWLKSSCGDVVWFCFDDFLCVLDKRRT